MTPGISIVVPCYNEARAIGRLLEAVYQQEYPRDDLEVVVADGMSTDGTPDVIRGFARIHPDLDLRVMDNPARSIPSGLNQAWRAARGASAAWAAWRRLTIRLSPRRCAHSSITAWNWRA